MDVAAAFLSVLAGLVPAYRLHFVPTPEEAEDAALFDYPGGVISIAQWQIQKDATGYRAHKPTWRTGPVGAPTLKELHRKLFVWKYNAPTEGTGDRQ